MSTTNIRQAEHLLTTARKQQEILLNGLRAGKRGTIDTAGMIHVTVATAQVHATLALVEAIREQGQT